MKHLMMLVGAEHGLCWRVEEGWMKREGELCERNIESPRTETYKKQIYLDIPLHREYYSTY